MGAEGKKLKAIALHLRLGDREGQLHFGLVEQ